MSDQLQSLREHLLYLLRGGGAHITFDDAVKDFPAELRGKKTRHLPHTAWQLLEHLRISQADIVDFCVNPKYKEREWPAAYWPNTPAPHDELAWDKSVRGFRADLRRMQKLIEDESTALFTQLPWGSGQTILREALLVADHNAYHLGQLVFVRKLLEAAK
jgi:hypothetical protein